MTGELAKALAAFQQEMPIVAKTKTANAGSYSYKYADLAAVSEQAMPLLTKHGLAFSACPRSTEHGYELVGRLLHEDGESLEGALPIRGNTAQELGSSITYARRYLFGCMTGLVTDDDDDGGLAGKAAKKTTQSRGKSSAAEPHDDEALNLTAAKTNVRRAWLETHERYSQSALEADFAQWASQPYEVADLQQLNEYAKHIREGGSDGSQQGG